jgi:pimeloyl-ACP methyl ester carboxylesterase
MRAAPVTFVLVHGAWHGGWCWRRVADLLQSRSHTVFSPSLSGLADRSHLLDGGRHIGLETHISDIANLIHWEDLSNVVLCGHSYGGMVISGVIERLAARSGGIRAAVYLDAMLPADGQSLLMLSSPKVRELWEDQIAKGANTLAPIPAARFQVNEHDQAWVDRMCTPQPVSTFTDKITITNARDRIAKKTYVRAVNYQAESMDNARALVKRDPAWHVVDIPCGHDAMIDMPERVAEVLIEAA